MWWAYNLIKAVKLGSGVDLTFYNIMNGVQGNAYIQQEIRNNITQIKQWTEGSHSNLHLSHLPLKH